MAYKIRAAPKAKVVDIRRYKEGDRAALIRLMEALKDHITSVDMWNIEDRKQGYGIADLRNTFKEVSEKKGVVYVAETNDKRVVGYAAVVVLPQTETFRLGTKKGIKIGEVTDLCVDSSYREYGVGTKLMEMAESYLKERSCTHVEVGMFWPNTDARKFYEKVGYELYNADYIKEL